MKKEDLKFGNIIETKNGKRYIYLECQKNVLIDLDGVNQVDLKNYNDDLTRKNNSKIDRDLNVEKIYEDYTLTNLLWKRPEPKPELSAKERNILVQALSDGYRWIARDKNKEVWLFDTKPYKLNVCDEEFWSNGIFNEKSPLILCKDLFTFLRWEDKKPTKIKSLLIVEE